MFLSLLTIPYQETIDFSHVVYKTKDRLPGHISPAGTSAI